MALRLRHRYRLRYGFRAHSDFGWLGRQRNRCECTQKIPFNMRLIPLKFADITALFHRSMRCRLTERRRGAASQKKDINPDIGLHRWHARSMDCVWSFCIFLDIFLLFGQPRAKPQAGRKTRCLRTPPSCHPAKDLCAKTNKMTQMPVSPSTIRNDLLLNITAAVSQSALQG